MSLVLDTMQNELPFFNRGEIKTLALIQTVFLNRVELKALASIYRLAMRIMTFCTRRAEIKALVTKYNDLQYD